MPTVFLDNLIFQVRYAFGYTYLDRCGQTLVDIERDFPSWVTSEVSPHAGIMNNPKADQHLEFHSESFTLTARRPDDLESFGRDAKALWQVVKRNLALREFIRVAARFQYILPQKSPEASERALRDSSLNISLPEKIAAEYLFKIRHMITVLEKEDLEYRVELKGITRTESIPQSVIASTPPKLLSKGQKAAQIEILKKRAAYQKNPMYAVVLDVDCVQYEPGEDLLPNAHVSKAASVVEADFLPILKAIE